MSSRFLRLAPLVALAGLAACKRDQPAPVPDVTATPTLAAPPVTAPPVTLPHPTPSASATPTPAPTPSATTAALDMGALRERRDPRRVLRFYADALHSRQWAAAARAWAPGMGVTAATLKAAYDRPTPPTLDIGKGQGDAGAGSQFYEAAVVLRFGEDARPETGTLSMRRVNDVDGATAEQLRWHIERSTIGAGQ